MGDFDLYGGPGYEHGALAQLLAASVQGEQAAAQLRVMGMGQAVDAALSGLGRGLASREARQESEAERRLRATLAREAMADQARRDEAYRSFQSAESERARQFQAEQANIDRVAAEQQFEQGQRNAFLREMAGAGAQQGYPAPGLLERGLGLMGGQQGYGQQGYGQSWVGIPPGAPGGPGGYMIGQEGGSGYQGLRREEGLFGGLQPMPQPESTEAKRLRLSEEQRQQLGKAVLQIRRLQAQQDKNVVIREETTLAEPLGLGGLDDAELEAAVLDAWPTLAPKVDLEGKVVDRRALDAKLKLLTKKQVVSVPNGAGLTGLDWSSVGNDPAIIHAAMEEVYGQGYNLPVTPEEVRAAANAKLLSQYPEYALRFRGAQVQGGADLLDSLQQRDMSNRAVGPVGKAVFNKGLLERSNLVFDQLDKALQSAAAAEFEIGPGQNGEVQFLPRQDGATASPKMQDALKRLMDDPKKGSELRAVLGIGADVRLTPSEVKDAGATRALSGADKPAAPTTKGAPTAPQSPKSPSTPTSPKYPSTPATPSQPAKRQSVVEMWNESRLKASQKPSAAKKKPQPVPASTSLIGLPESTIVELLLGGGR